MSYPGAKSQAGVWQRIIGQMPPHSVYVEAFCGEAHIFFRKRRAESSILIDRNPRVISAVNARLGAVAGVRAMVGNALQMLPEFFAWLPSDAVIYCDPPYLLGTRSKQLLYRFGGASDELTDADHATLLAALVQAKCNVLLSGYPNALYSSQLHGWRCLEYDAMTRGGKRRECLWCNFPEPASLHDWRFAGFNYRQRFGDKRFVARLVKRIAAMPPRRAGYIFAELENAIGQRHGRREGLAADPATPSLALAAMTSTSATGGATRG